eukprot:CAMPEP_0204208130 /NCGR_PEP_ID=MMETSP0361-20130328/72264_1 /ASSEMBLY_ACC=CAM_ASM_000343 /TAXON_ID=268821 /ORGANISM="Scrippsiella Hangoei, Strain SHTV-5" /LENGTH=313 /DNA_ID=CAMNT_0051171843 /DNA_START=80 /DNA_END=1019 /DNA_ORIENTATION=-
MSVHWSENRVLGDRPVDDDRHTPVDPQQVADPGRVAEDPLADEVVGGREAQHHGVAAAGRVLVPAVAPLVRGAHDVHPVAGAAAAGEAQEAADEGSARELDAMLLEERSDVRHLTEAAPAIGEPLQQVRLHAARQILEGCILLVAEPRNGHEEVLPRGLTELAPEGGAAVEAFGEGGGLRKQLRQRMVAKYGGVEGEPWQEADQSIAGPGASSVPGRHQSRGTSWTTRAARGPAMVAAASVTVGPSTAPSTVLPCRSGGSTLAFALVLGRLRPQWRRQLPSASPSGNSAGRLEDTSLARGEGVTPKGAPPPSA